MTLIHPASRFVVVLSSGLAWIVTGIAGCTPQSTTPPVSEVRQETSPANKAVTESTPMAVWKPWHAENLETDDFALEDGFRALSFFDFESFFAKPPKEETTPTWQQVGRAIVCTGKPKGYLYSKEKFADFTLRLEFRFAPPTDEAAVKDFNPNSGVLVYITEPHKQWPKSLEVQGKFAEMAKINTNGGAAKIEIADDAAARESARKPVGEWNALEIISKDGALTALLNETKVCESQPSDVSEGAIGLQSEDFEVHFRRLRIRAE